MLKLYVFLFVVSIVGGVGYSAKWYYTDTQMRIAQLRENNVKLQQVAETMENTINNMEADAALNEQLNKELSSKLQQAEQGLNNLRGRFAEIDISRLARDDPNGLEERINRGVQRLIEKIAEETGAVSDPTDEPVTAE